MTTDTTALGGPEHPLRVAIVGSGPSGFYAAEHLQRCGLIVQVDMYDRLPTPFGLVRGGVAPDHAKIKSVTRVYDKIAGHSDFRFFGNVEFGRHIDHDDIADLYHAVIYATGARKARRLGVSGEDLPGSHPAPAFVGWYNGHPDFGRRVFDLSVDRAVVVGNGNVAVDAARILVQPVAALAETDIAEYALEALRTSRIRHVVVLGRRGPVQAALTPKELKELGEIDGVDIVVDPRELELDSLSVAELAGPDGDRARKNLALLEQYVARPRNDAHRVIEFRFLRSPLEMLGEGRLTAVRIGRNRLVSGPDGVARTQATGEEETIGAGLVLAAVGYVGAPLPGVPFDQRRGVIPNDRGAVLGQDGSRTLGEYAVGWIKRGPVGIIGTNKPDALETVDTLLADVTAGRLLEPRHPQRAAAEARLNYQRPEHTTYADWQIIDQIEQERGRPSGRARTKFTRISDMLDALAEAKEAGGPRPAA